MKPDSKIASFFDALFVNFHHLNIVEKIESVVQKMNLAEKTFFFVLSIIFVTSSLTLLVRLNNYFLVEVPSFGGNFTEGLVGSPRFINPVLAISDTDKDLVSLVYSGLLKSSPESGFIPDLASSYTLSDDGTVYDFEIREDAYFHDGESVTADDVIFTVGKILDPTVKSPKRTNWEGVLVEKVSEKSVRFTLAKPYAPFVESLAIGILPKHAWEKASSEEFPFSERNIEPIGSGPYKIDKVERNGSGILTAITLASFHDFVLGQPKIQKIAFKFFQNENDLYKAYASQQVESASGLGPATVKQIARAEYSGANISLPRVFGVFLNQNIAPIFLHNEVREALDLSAPKQKIVDEVLFGFGVPLNGPTPENTAVGAEGDLEKAKSLLANNGWAAGESGFLEKKTKAGTETLRFSITTSDAPELKKTAGLLKETWEQLGAEVDVKVFEGSDLSQSVIRGRKYDALLFGEVISADTDLYPFWHSSERNDPGLNISLYANIAVDKLLEEIRGSIDKAEIASKKALVISEIQKDRPTIFLFAPQLLYIKPKKVKNVLTKNISFQNERFVSINSWFIETDKVWKIFAQK